MKNFYLLLPLFFGASVSIGQNVGIGLNNPAVKLHVHVTEPDGSIQISNGLTGTTFADGLSLRMSNLNALLTNHENGDLSFAANSGSFGVYGSPSITIKPSGAVGIGTFTPTAQLEVAGQVKITGGSPGVGKVLTSDAAGLASWTTLTAGNQWANNGNNIYNANTGNVGIGINAPAVNLHVTAASSPSQVDGNILITNGITGHTIADGLRIRMNSSNASIQNSENGDLLIQTNQGVTGEYGSPAIWIKPSGAIGIGTSTPTAHLEVAGQVKITGGSPGVGKVLTSNAEGLATWTVPVSSTQWNTNGNNIYNANNGFVGIGISNPAANLQVNDATEGSPEGNILITNQLSGTSLFDGLRLRMNFLVASIQNNENGDMFFQTNQGATGEYGSPAIWIKPSGAIGIGTSTPGAKLEILGSGSNQPALNINDGFMKVSGANKTAFTILGSESNSSGHILALNYANQSATDILLVTHNYNPGGVGGLYHNNAVGVFWTGSAWTIFSEDTQTPMLGKSFNVLVIKQ
jgi:hypothetical protein